MSEVTAKGVNIATNILTIFVTLPATIVTYVVLDPILLDPWPLLIAMAAGFVAFGLGALLTLWVYLAIFSTEEGG